MKIRTPIQIRDIVSLTINLTKGAVGEHSYEIVDELQGEGLCS
jgi:hypothetical protein